MQLFWLQLLFALTIVALYIYAEAFDCAPYKRKSLVHRNICYKEDNTKYWCPNLCEL